MSTAPNIRQSAPADTAAINHLVTQVIVECYGHLLPNYEPDPNADWEHAWLAEKNGKIVAVLLTARDWIDDLWISKAERRSGIGSRLLQIAEQEIATRGNQQARLRLVAENLIALKFYTKNGWQHVRQFPHEKFSFEMVEMSKPLSIGTTSRRMP
ncbi:MAG: GNAT family N-acetyltransferase [Aestuariivirga sp.]